VRAAVADFGLLATLTALAACGANAGVQSVTVEVDGVEVTCRAETGNLDPAACGEWATFIIQANPEVARVVFTRHPRGETCEVTLFDEGGAVIGNDRQLPCRPLNPEGSGDAFDMGG
jgi:hypothetical protein